MRIYNLKDKLEYLDEVIKIEYEEWADNKEENYIIDFMIENEAQKYQVFSIYQIKTEDYYIDTEFKDNEFGKFIDTLRERSIKDFNVEISSKDSILTLSTCANNNNNNNNNKYRIVLHVKKQVSISNN